MAGSMRRTPSGATLVLPKALGSSAVALATAALAAVMICARPASSAVMRKRGSASSAASRWASVPLGTPCAVSSVSISALQAPRHCARPSWCSAPAATSMVVLALQRGGIIGLAIGQVPDAGDAAGAGQQALQRRHLPVERRGDLAAEDVASPVRPCRAGRRPWRGPAPGRSSRLASGGVSRSAFICFTVRAMAKSGGI